MPRLIVSGLASDDEAEILTDLAVKAGLRTAIKFRALFDRRYRRLTEHPASGALRPQLGVGIRIAVVAPYIIFYAVAPKDDTVTILRVLHGRLDISAQSLTE